MLCDVLHLASPTCMGRPLCCGAVRETRSLLSSFEQCRVCPLQVASDQMIQLLSDEDTLRRVQGAPQASLQTLAAMLALTSSQMPSALQEAAPQETLHDGTRDSLRYMLPIYMLSIR